MCGIAGIYAYGAASAAVERDELLRIRDCMAARGPDGMGDWTSADGHVGLAHRRLSIIDLGDGGAQPMTSADGRYTITFNGEIYNHRALRMRLEQRGHTFRSQSDTEVLLHMFADMGEHMVHDLRGMFALGIWDHERRRLFLARDPYGIKPLYYADDGRTLRFASQVKALIAGGQVSRENDPAGWVGFYLLGSVPEPFTIYRQISALPAGCTAFVDARGMTGPTRYHSIATVLAEADAAPHRPVQVEAQIGDMHAALLDSVRHHLIADVPVGAFLSAGLDSSALVGLMRDCGHADIQTITINFDEFIGQQADEAPIAGRTAAYYGTRHTNRTVTVDEFIADLPSIMAAMDQPSIDGVNTWFVSKAAKEQGLKVVLSGLGGDELLGGYPSFVDIPKWTRRLRPFSAVPGVGRVARRVMTGIGPRRLSLNPKAAGMLELGGTYAGAYLLRRGLFMPWELDRLCDPDLVAEGLRRLQPLGLIGTALEGAPSDAHSRVVALESSLYMRNQLLRDSDWASMAHGLELRVPLVDSVLLQRFASITRGRPFAPGKNVLSSAPSKPLPFEIETRVKTGFTTPMPAWRQRLGDETADVHEPWARGWARHIARNVADASGCDAGFALRRPTAARAARRRPRASGAPAGGLTVLALVTDAHGGFGGISQYNRDALETISRWSTVAAVHVVPRLSDGIPGSLPSRLHYDHTGLGGKLRYVAAVTRLARRLKSVDLVLCGHINLLPIAAVAATISGAPLVLSLHGVEAWRRGHPIRPAMVRRTSALVLSVSEVTRDRFVSWARIPADRVAIVPNTVDIDDFSGGIPDGAVAAQFGLIGRTVLLTLGRMESRERAKGFDEVIDVLPRLAASIGSIIYVIAGDGTDRERLVAKARALGISDRVVFTGRIDQPTKRALYRLADAYVMPSRGEGFGIVVLEALASGAPVVGSIADGTREALRGGELGILADPDDPITLESAIRQALARPRGVPPGLTYFHRDRFDERLRAALGRVCRV